MASYRGERHINVFLQALAIYFTVGGYLVLGSMRKLQEVHEDR